MAPPSEADRLLKHLRRQPHSWACCAWREGAEAQAFAHRAEALQPIGSVMKVPLLYGLCQAVLAGEADWSARVPLAEVEALWWPGSDGGAHEAALKSLGAQGRLRDDGRIAWRDLAWAMIAHSDNAATDYFVGQLGQARLEGLPAALGLAGQLEPPTSTLGAFLNWAGPAPGHRPTAWTQSLLRQPRQAFRFAAAQRARAALADPRHLAWLRGLGRHSLPDRRVKALAPTLPQASAKAVAQLMAGVLGDRLAPPGVAAMMQGFLGWPLEAAPQLRAQHAALGYKPGTIEGVLAGAWYQRPASGGPGSVAVLLMKDLPLGLWRRCLATGSMQALERQLLADPQHLAKALGALAQA